MDDILIFNPPEKRQQVNLFKKELLVVYKMHSLGELDYFYSMKII